MKMSWKISWVSLYAAVVLLLAGQAAWAQTANVPARVVNVVDETQTVTLKGNVHPLARAEFDQGAVSYATPMNRMMLLLQRSPEQESALQQLMGEQQTKDSPNFHKWLTPEQFGSQFGPADADIQAVTGWLQAHGFQNVKVGEGRTAIEFSGNVGQVQEAFRTEIHRYLVKGENRQANATDPQIPAGLTPVVAGIVSLHNFPRTSYKRNRGIYTRTAEGTVKPLFTTSKGCGTGQGQPCYILGPADFAKVYNIPSTLDGTGVTIAIVGVSNINPQDVIDFRNLFGLPANFTSANVVLNGPDPGLGSAEDEADLDVQVSGMVAPNATIKLVVAEDTLTATGIDLNAIYIIDNNIAPVMSLSVGQCESSLGSTGNAFYNQLWEQAAAQGITVTVATGDSGSAGCDDFTTEARATGGFAVSGIASTPYNVAVGGTDFDDVGTQSSFWGPNSTDGKQLSALGYIRETTWNDSCAANATSANLNTVCASANGISAGSGGPSSVYAKPAWQGGIIPNGIAAGDNHRYIPDVSLFASDGRASDSFYLVCQADAVPAGNPPSCATSGSFSFQGIGGTSASSPAFAGIMALINQNNGRQGNPNPVLYKIAATAGQSCNSSTEGLTGSTCAFNDVTKGNISVPCAGNSTNCSSKTTNTNGVLVSTGSATTPGWSAATGYDLATGLGSVNVANLATQWPLAVGKFTPTTTSLKVNGGTSAVNITHGTGVTVAVSVSPSSGPTGDVALIGPNPPVTVNGGIGQATLSASGSVTFNNVILPGGNYNLLARYAGDDTFAASTSPGVPVVVAMENSRLQYGIFTFDSLGNILSTNATSVTYGSPYILRIDILNSSGTSSTCQPWSATGVTTGCAFDATGTVTITDNGSPLDTGTFPINSAGSAEDQPIQLSGGTHTLSATYSGDISYNPVSTAVLDSVTVAKAVTQTTVSSSSSIITSGTSVTLTATIATQSNGAGPTGSVKFTNGGTSLGSATCQPTSATATAAAFCTATLTTAISGLYPPVAVRPEPPGVPIVPLVVALASLLLFALGLRWMPKGRSRAYAYAGLVAVVLLVVGVAGCGGGSSGGGGGSTTRTITANYSGDTNYSSSSGSMTITIN